MSSTRSSTSSSTPADGPKRTRRTFNDRRHRGRGRGFGHRPCAAQALCLRNRVFRGLRSDGHGDRRFAVAHGRRRGRSASGGSYAQWGPYDGPDDDVKRWILEHSDVIEDGWKSAGSVLPVSFNVIVRPDTDSGASATTQLEGWLEGKKASLSKRLGELGGTSELRVEISLDRGTFVDSSEELRGMKAEMADRPAGVRRLLEKRVEKTEKELADRTADDLYPAMRARIAEQCLDIEEYRAPARESGQTPILMASCLVAEPGIQNLGAELTAIQNEQPAIAIRFLGPWPPYSFADMSDSAAEMADYDGQRTDSIRGKKDQR
ncbi:GvpL/GvpF family gas vesicle protein [Brevibacterium marinum]|nr:GvpL/GvpF family gas vesicle protein [Brevibacterium marinum]